MSRIPIPTTIEAAPTASQPLLAAVQKQLGIIPTYFGSSPIVRPHSRVTSA